jgi:hypothetical protein
MWSRVSGWEVTPASPVQTYRSGAIRFESALAAHPELRDAFAHIVKACR